VRQRTRLINQFHHLLALSFPELALLVNDIAIGWVLELCSRYPTAKLLAVASTEDLAAIPYLPHERIPALLEHARGSIASLHDEIMDELVRDQVRQLREVKGRQKRLENMLKDAYARLPQSNFLDTINGIGEVTAAILTAFIVDIDRFATPSKLVAYFGALPVEASSGVDRDGKPRGPKRYVMSRRGNDLVRRYLWMAALSAVRFNPAVRPLYLRVVARHPERKAIAIGHAMGKLLRLGFAVWKTGKPFDPKHYPWGGQEAKDEAGAKGLEAGDEGRAKKEGELRDETCDNGMSQEGQAAGLTLTAELAQKEVTAACAASVAQEETAGAAFVDFAHVKRQLPLARLLDHLGLSTGLRGKGAQRRCACPIHRGDGRGRTFSVHLEESVFQCFDAACGKKGDVIDLWAALRQLSLRDAALDLVETFGLEPAAKARAKGKAKGTEKRHG
jgi:hypothetical protein